MFSNSLPLVVIAPLDEKQQQRQQNDQGREGEEQEQQEQDMQVSTNTDPGQANRTILVWSGGLWAVLGCHTPDPPPWVGCGSELS